MTPPETQEKAERMLDNPIGEDYLKLPVKVSGKILKQLSSGIYRTPANVVKELVSNSFDADARSVMIDLNYPEFRSFSCYDEGYGLSANEFQVKMQEIGGSAKGFTGGTTPRGRPIIGRIGIGLLAVGQISPQFRIVSGKQGELEGFEAIVNLERFFTSGPESYRPLEELSLGTVSLRKYEKEKSDHFTLVRVASVDAVFQDRMTIPSDWKRGAHFQGFQGTKKESFEAFLNWVSEFTSLKKLAGYDQFIWELALLCPIPYANGGPVRSARSSAIARIRQRLKELDFSVVVDGIALRKPISFPNEEVSDSDDYGVYEIDIQGEVEKRPVKAMGYYYHQIKRIVPAELRGILPRIRNVGIGLHSNNLFRVLQENPIAAFQLSGELYVEEGLDEALNIDRNSFFESDPGFIFIRDRLEEQLTAPKGILYDVRRRQDRARKRGRSGADLEFESALVRIARAGGLNNPRIHYSDERQARPLRVDPSGRLVIYDSPNLPRGKDARRLALLYFTCFELALASSRNDAERAERFYELVRLVFEW